MTAREPILVLDAETDQALAIVRGLSEKNIPVHVAGTSPWGPAYWSFRAGRRFLYPSPLHFPKEFVSRVSELLRRNRYEAVFPASDSTTVVLEKFREKLPKTPFCMPSPESYERVTNKFFGYELAEKCGLSVPSTVYPESIEGAEEEAAPLGFPVVVKPHYSRYYDEKNGTVRVGESVVAFEPWTLKELLRKFRQGRSLPCVQKWVAGKGVGVEILMKKGEALAVFCHERIREMNPFGSGSSAARSIPLREDLVEPSAALLRACDFEGAAMVEFRIDDETEKAWFMEINGRFWGTLALPLACGVNFPYLYLETLVRGKEAERANRYAQGIAMRSLWKETTRLMTTLKGKPSEQDLPFPSRGEGVWEYFSSFFQRRQIYADLEILDPFPGIVATAAVIVRTIFRFLSRPFRLPEKNGGAE